MSKFSKSSGNLNVLSAKKEIRTPLLERKIEIQSRTCEDKPGGTWQLKHGLFTHKKAKGVEENNNEITFDQVSEIKLNAKHSNNDENISDESDESDGESHHTNYIPEHLTNGVIKPNKTSDSSETKYTDGVFGKSTSNFQGKQIIVGAGITSGDDVNGDGVEINHYNSQKRPPRLLTPTQVGHCIEINHYDSETRPARLSPANRRRNKVDHKNLKETHNPVRKFVNNRKGVSSRTAICNGNSEMCEATRRQKNVCIDSTDCQTEKSSPKIKHTQTGGKCNNTDIEKTGIKFPSQQLNNQNYEIIKNNLKEEKPKKINNHENPINKQISNHTSSNGSDVRINSPHTKRTVISEQISNHANGYDCNVQENIPHTKRIVISEQISNHANGYDSNVQVNSPHTKRTVISEQISNHADGYDNNVQVNSPHMKRTVISEQISNHESSNDSDVRINSPYTKRTVINKLDFNLNDVSKQTYGNVKEVLVDNRDSENHVDTTQNNCNITNEYHYSKENTQTNVTNEPYSSKVNYRKMRHNFNNEEESRNVIVNNNKKENYTAENKDKIIQNKTKDISSMKTEKRVRNRNRRRRVTESNEQNGVDINNNEESITVKKEEENPTCEIYRRSRRSPDNAQKIRRYRSTERLSHNNRTDNTNIRRRRDNNTRRLNGINKEESTNNSIVSNHNNTNHNKPSICNGNDENNNTSQNNEPVNCSIVQNNEQVNCNILHNSEPENCDVFHSNEAANCKCGYTGLPEDLQIISKIKSKSKDYYRQSLNDLNQDKNASITNERRNSQIIRSISKSDPSLLSSSMFTNDNFTSNNLGKENYNKINQKHNRGNGTKSVIPRKRTTSISDSKRRHHSTGHSPDITILLQHLICDIEEEEIVSSSEDETKNCDEKFKLQQLETFNSNLNELITSSADAINLFGVTIPNKAIHRTFSEDDIGLKLLRKQRLKRKVKYSYFSFRELPYFRDCF